MDAAALGDHQRSVEICTTGLERLPDASILLAKRAEAYRALGEKGQGGP